MHRFMESGRASYAAAALAKAVSPRVRPWSSGTSMACNMVARGGRPGVSLEDKNRSGVWVRLSWLQGQAKAAPTWRQFSADELLAKYPPKEA